MEIREKRVRIGKSCWLCVVTKRHISERVIGDQYEENREEHNRSGIKWRNGNWNAFRMWK